MNHHSEQAPVAPGGLTSRQCEVLDLLLQHRTTKEIARQLAISPHTVDQRIRLAKEKLGVHRRSDLATAYRELQSICGKSVYEESRIATEPTKLSELSLPIWLERRKGATQPLAPVQLVPAIFDGPDGTLVRIGAIFAISAATLIVGIGGMAIMEQLSRLVS